MKTRIRFINLALCSAIVILTWFLMPASQSIQDVAAFGIPPCGLMQGSRLAAQATNNTICDDPGCEPPQQKSFKKCISAVGWECLFEGSEQVTCNENCWVIILKQDQTCQCVPPSQGCPPGTEYNVAACECQPVQEEGDPPDCEECDRPSPILISIRGNRLELTDWANGVEFDLNADGSPEQISWTQGGADDAFLVLDRNGNGVIDDGTELFGNFTPQPDSQEPNGFLALSVFDQPETGGNGDGWITDEDSAYGELGLWIDWNHDGFSQASELRGLSSSRINGISLAYRETRRTDRHGNAFRFVSRVRMRDRSAPRIKFAVDVFFLGQP